MWKFIKVVLVYVISIDTMRRQREKRDGGGGGAYNAMGKETEILRFFFLIRCNGIPNSLVDLQLRSPTSYTFWRILRFQSSGRMGSWGTLRHLCGRRH